MNINLNVLYINCCKWYINANVQCNCISKEIKNFNLLHCAYYWQKQYCFELRKRKTDSKVYPNSSSQFSLSTIIVCKLRYFCSAKEGNPEDEVLIFGMSFQYFQLDAFTKESIHRDVIIQLPVVIHNTKSSVSLAIILYIISLPHKGQLFLPTN